MSDIRGLHYKRVRQGASLLVKKVRERSGQIAVEYILLLSLSVTIAVLISTLVVSRNPENPGFLIVKWREFIEFIAGDVIDP